MPFPLRSAILIAVLAAVGWQPATAQPGARDSTWKQTFVRSYDRVARSAGLQPLRNEVLADGRREVRIWFGGGIGHPQDLFRFQISEAGVEGELILHWNAVDRESKPGESFHDLMLYSLSGSCEGFAVAAGRGTCRALFEPEPDWADALSRAEIAGLWMLPDPSELPLDADEQFLCLDCTSMTVELRDGPMYRAYQYSEGDLDLNYPEAEHAREVWQSIISIRRLQRFSDVHRVYRGITMGMYGATFRPCENGETWEFRSHLDYLARIAGVMLPDAGEEGYLLEIIGVPSPEWQARRWESEHARVFQGTTLVSATPTDTLGCE